jgi:hypothetical protein
MLNCKYCKLQAVGSDYWGEKKERICTNPANSRYDEKLGYAKDYNAGVCFAFETIKAFQKCAAFCKSESALDSSR